MSDSCDDLRDACIADCDKAEKVAENCEKADSDVLWSCGGAAILCFVTPTGTTVVPCALGVANCWREVVDLWDCEDEYYAAIDECLDECDEYGSWFHKMEYWHHWEP